MNQIIGRKTNALFMMLMLVVVPRICALNKLSQSPSCRPIPTYFGENREDELIVTSSNLQTSVSKAL